LVVLLAVLVAALIVAGCGGSEDKGGAPGEQEDTGSGSGSASEAKGGETTRGSSEGGEGQLMQVDVASPVNGTSYVAPLTEVFGEVFIGENSFVAANTILRAAPQNSLEIGSDTNAQDNIIIRALDRSSAIGDETSIAHHAIIRDSDIGDFAFVGFNAEVVDSIVNNGAFILHGARVEGVEIPENALVDVGQEITTQDKADDLPTAPEATEEFREEVLDVNRELAAGYIELYDNGAGYESVIEAGPNPSTSFIPEQTEPQIGEEADIREFVRLIGDARLGANSRVQQRTAIRADDGTPIVIGEGARIDDRVTFHALAGTDVRIGDNLTAGDDAVLHGPLQMRDNVTVEDDAVVFRVVVGNNVDIGEEAIIVGPAIEEGEEPSLRIPPGTVIPDGAVITDQEDLDAILEEQ